MATVELDVRDVFPFERHEKIFDLWHSLPVGDEILLVNDHDPKPLHYQFMAEYAGQFEWTSEERGPQWWEAHIKRVAAAE